MSERICKGCGLALRLSSRVETDETGAKWQCFTCINPACAYADSPQDRRLAPESLGVKEQDAATASARAAYVARMKQKQRQ